MKYLLLILLCVVALKGHELVSNQIERSKDGGGKEYMVEYNLLSVVLVSLVSAMGFGLTAAVDRMASKKVLPMVDIGRYFGTGVIIATAFIHMLPGAIVKLQDSRLPKFISEFEPFGAGIALAAVFLIHLIETTLLPHSHEKAYSDINGYQRYFPIDHRKTTTYILELGILSHSIFVGLDLGLKESSGFLGLLIAICFHQFFEGIGLGARIAESQFYNKRTPVLMGLAYSITTSLGILLGILIHTSYNKDSVVAIITEAALDAVSAGILIYIGLVELMGKDLSINSDFGTKPTKTKFVYLFALYAGAFAMTVLAIWA
ncbi:low-affinity Zn(2+) transporter zrt2 [Massospora cicadina]|nr:low-affinity Zn(2+) transporter zrt2 [Massospora cicadina]